MPPIPASQNPNLIKVFKPSAPDVPLYADQRQINDLPGTLIKWDQRDAWLAAHATKPGKGKPKAEAGAGAEPPAEAGVANPAAGTVIPKLAQPGSGRTRAELLAEAQAKGIAVTKRMTVAQLEAALSAA